MEEHVDLIDSHKFLVQDRCEHPVVTHGHVWPNKIQVWSQLEDSLGKAPADQPRLEHAIVAAKLDAVRKTTRLGTHKVPDLDAPGRFRTTNVSNSWAVVYGRAVQVPNLSEDCGAQGCGGMNGPLILLAEPDQVRLLANDGAELPKER
jgi:hypothetical protein